MSWEPLNLAHLEERPALEPTLGGVGICYRGKRHVFSGPQEAAKTLAAYAIALAEIRAGGTVVLIDFEMGQWDTRDRLRELGASASELEHLRYIEPEAPASEEAILGLVDLNPTLVIIDAAAGAYDLQGLDDNKRADVEKFSSIYVRAFWLRAIATIVLDHVVKDVDSRGKYAIGSERKIGSADVHIGFEAITPLTRGGTGLYKLLTHKDRFGHLPRPRAGELELRSDPITYAISWRFRPPSEGVETQGGFRPTALMERVSRYLELQSERVSQREVERSVTGQAQWVRRAIDQLVEEGYVSETRGPRKERSLLSEQAFQEGDCVPTASGQVDADSAPTASRQKPLAQAKSANASDCVPTASDVRELTASLAALSPTGERPDADAVVSEQKRTFVGDEMYPAFIADAVRGDQISDTEAEEVLTVHKLVERSREALDPVQTELDYYRSRLGNDKEPV